MKSKENKIQMNTKTKETTCHRKSIRIFGKKVERTFSRKSDADRWYLEKKREKELIESGLMPQIKETTVEDFAHEWLITRKANGKPIGSWNSDEARLRKYILPQFGKREFSKISTQEWERHLDSLVAEELISPATRNRIRSLATKMYNDGLRKGVVLQNPVSIIPKLKESMDAWDFWETEDEVSSYLEAAKNESQWFYLFACISLNLGTRLGETLALDFSLVNLNQRRIRIAKIFEEATNQVKDRTKSHLERWLGINESLYDILKEYKRSVNSTYTPLFLDNNAQRIRERKVRHVHDAVCKKAKVKMIRIHDLRHTYASHFVMNGGSLTDLQKLLGHSSPNMTLKYAHLSPGYLEKKAEIVSFGTPTRKLLSIAK